MHQLNSLIAFLLSPIGLAAVSLMGIGIVLASRSPRLAVMSLALPLFVSTIGKYRYIKAEYVFPLNYLETYSRPTFALSLGVLLLILLSNKNIHARFKPQRSSIFFLIFQLHFSVLMIVNAVPNGLLSIPIFTLSFLAMTLLERQIRSDRWRSHFLETIVACGAVFTMACTYQWMLAPHNSVWAGRFIGVTDNSQHTAQFLSLFIIPTVYLLFSGTGNSLIRKLVIGVLAVEFGLLLYTGSRTGLLMTLMPLAIMFRHRSRYFVFAAIGMAIVAAIAAVLTPETQEATQRLVSTKDTRSELFKSLWQQFLDNPLFGEMNTITYMGVKRVQVRENTYLMVASMMGLVGISIFGTFLVFVVGAMRKLYSYPNSTGKPEFHDFVLASLVSILAGAFFEGFLFAIVGPCFLLLYLYSSMAEHLARKPFPRETRVATTPVFSANRASA